MTDNQRIDPVEDGPVLPLLGRAESLVALGLVGVLLAALVAVVPAVAMSIRDEALTSEAIDRALEDQDFRGRIADAGYRVEKATGFGGPNRVRYVLARCARANEAGPLPCDPFPADPAHTGIPVEARP